VAQAPEKEERAMRRALLLAAAMAITVVLVVGIASADPIKSKNAQTFTLDCVGGQSVTVVFVLQNAAVVNNVVGTTETFVGTSFTGTATYTDPETGQLVTEDISFHPGSGQKAGLQDSLTTCDGSISFVDPDLGDVTVDLTITGFFTPHTS
jgi:putative ribosome biogenesis GTPase RsgA